MGTLMAVALIFIGGESNPSPRGDFCTFIKCGAHFKTETPTTIEKASRRMRSHTLFCLPLPGDSIVLGT